MEVIESMVKKILSNLASEYEIEYLNKLSFDDDLRNYGLNSMSSIELIVMLEKEFDISVPDDELSTENVCTINKIIQLVKKCSENNHDKN